LAVDAEGNFIVFELKLARGPDKTIGQLLRYMGWIKANVAKERNVYGVIVAKEVHEKLRYAALLVPSVSLLEYEIDFRLKTADFNTTGHICMRRQWRNRAPTEMGFLQVRCTLLVCISANESEM